MSTDVFDGAREADIKDLLKLAGLNETGQEYLTDGRTGEMFSRPVTVGYKYILKLVMIVELILFVFLKNYLIKKIHLRKVN